MPTHAYLAAKLLRDAAAFFQNIAKQNAHLEDQMKENATIYVQVADLVEESPTQQVHNPATPAEAPRSHAQLAAALLRDAAAFFRKIAKQNPPLKEQMEENGEVFGDVADLIENYPTGEIPDPDEIAEPAIDVSSDAHNTLQRQQYAPIKPPPKPAPDLSKSTKAAPPKHTKKAPIPAPNFSKPAKPTANPEPQSTKASPGRGKQVRERKVSTQLPHPDLNPLSQHNVRLNAHRDFVDPPFGLSFPTAAVPRPITSKNLNGGAVCGRGNYVCRYCGFRSVKYQQSVGPYDAFTNSQAHCGCIMCSQVMTLDKVAVMRSGALVYLPEIRQAELHVFARLIYVCRISQGRAASLAKAALGKLVVDRRHEARAKFGTDDPFELAKRLAQCATRADYNALLEKVRDIRLFPLDRRIIKEGDLEYNQFPQILAYWRSLDGPFGGLIPAQMDLTEFQSRIEAVFGRLSIDA